jgi:HNH endonuclease/Homeodomain-like domain
MNLDPLDVLAMACVKLPHPCVIERDGNGCAIWPFTTDPGGYGQYYPWIYGERVPVPRRVHRAVYMMFYRPIPSTVCVDHVWDRGCRSRACFWPEHLEAVTQAENNRRAGRALRERRQRPCGHSWEATRPGRSDCAICHREREAARRIHRPHPPYEQGRKRARMVRELLATGLTPMEVALRVGISRSTVYGIRNSDRPSC